MLMLLALSKLWLKRNKRRLPWNGAPYLPLLRKRVVAAKSEGRSVASATDVASLGFNPVCQTFPGCGYASMRTFGSRAHWR
ncbi:hypothetical protein, partial [Xanthomonas phaseoli]|uniref:hypothetical protein n=1 Tax=Xanthomonas phaseoli TaxID=1985254 RepID=UPI001ED94664